MARRWCNRTACNAARAGGGASKLSALQIWSWPGPARPAGQGDGGESSGRSVGDGAPDRLRLGSYCCPPVGGKDDDGDVSPGEVLLKDKVLVAGDKGLETGLFGFVEQLPVRDAGPAHLGRDLFSGKPVPRVIDDGLSLNARALEHPRARYLARHALDVFAF